MNKTAIKNFAIWARKQLIEAVSQKAFEYEITEGGANDPGLEAVAGRPLTQTEKQQRAQLIAEIRSRGYDAVMEEAAYTWFNRFIALRFMEVNGYLPSKVRIFTDENGEFRPEILKQALEIDLEGLERERVLSYLDVQDNEGLYRYLLITQCSALNEALPYMFEKISNWTELLFPANLLRPDSIIARMISDIPEEDWTDQVQIIGWLYQFYNSELKDDTYALLKKNVKISKERLPSATQLFTPDWIVRYMVENSLGRLAISSQLSAASGQLTEADRITKEKEIAEDFGWKYYLPEAEQTPEVRNQLNQLSTTNYQLPTIKFLDPCMGSGHVLVYAFDVLMQLYTAEGWSERDAARSILENNLYGLDIDTRAGQLAYFAVMMKARKHFRRLFTAGIRPNIFAISDSAFLDDELIGFAAGDDAALRDALKKLRECFRDAKEFGSLIRPEIHGLDKLLERIKEIASDHPTDLIAAHFRNRVADELLPLALQAQMLSQKYDVVCTNPPYMGSSGMSEKLSDYVKSAYPDSKSDLFSVFIERGFKMLELNGKMSMITMQSWMFLSSFEKLRNTIIKHHTILNMLHLGPRGFDEIGGEVVQTTAFVFHNQHLSGYTGVYYRLIEPKSEDEKKILYLSGKSRYSANQENFNKIPGSPIAYWVGEKIYDSFIKGEPLSNLCVFRTGMKTGDNDRFLRLWWEVEKFKEFFDCPDNSSAINSKKKWFPYNKGGSFRKWYGNNDYVVNFENDGFEMFSNVKKEKRHVQNLSKDLRYRACITWTLLSSLATAFRYKTAGSLYDMNGMCMFPEKDTIMGILSFVNSKVMFYILNITAPTMAFQLGDIAKTPIYTELIYDNKIQELSKECISVSTKDWDSFETSWDFKKHPLI